MTWTRPTKQQLLEDMIDGLKAQPQWADTDMSELSTTGQLLRAVVSVLDNLYDMLARVEGGLSISGAAGTRLDALVKLLGITRRPASYGTVTLRLGGTPGTVIPAGSRVQADNGSVWATDEDATIQGTGEADIGATCTEAGYYPAPAGTITQILDPVAGWQTATNPADAVAGQNQETDAELAHRALWGRGAGGSASDLALWSRVTNLSWVAHAGVFSNRSEQDLVLDPTHTMPPHSLSVLVYPGPQNESQRQELAQTIWHDGDIPAGIAMYGDETWTVDTPWGGTIEVAWMTALTREVEIRVKVQTAYLGDDAPETVSDRQSAVEAVVDQWFDRLAVGEDVYPDRLLAYLIDQLPWLRSVNVTRKSGSSWVDEPMTVEATAVAVLLQLYYTEVV